MADKDASKQRRRTVLDPNALHPKNSVDRQLQDEEASGAVYKATRGAARKLQGIATDPPPILKKVPRTQNPNTKEQDKDKEKQVPLQLSIVRPGDDIEATSPASPSSEAPLPPVATPPRQPTPMETDMLSPDAAGRHKRTLVEQEAAIELCLQNLRADGFQRYSASIPVYQRGSDMLGLIPEILKSAMDINGTPIKAKRGRIYRDPVIHDNDDDDEPLPCGKIQDIIGGISSAMKSDVFKELPLQRNKLSNGTVVYKAKLFYQNEGNDAPTNTGLVIGPAPRNVGAVSNDTIQEESSAPVSGLPNLRKEYNYSNSSIAFLDYLAQTLDAPTKVKSRATTVRAGWEREKEFRAMRDRAVEMFGDSDCTDASLELKSMSVKEDGPFKGWDVKEDAIMDVLLVKRTMYRDSKNYFKSALRFSKFANYLKNPASTEYDDISLTQFYADVKGTVARFNMQKASTKKSHGPSKKTTFKKRESDRRQREADEVSIYKASKKVKAPRKRAADVDSSGDELEPLKKRRRNDDDMRSDEIDIDDDDLELAQEGFGSESE